MVIKIKALQLKSLCYDSFNCSTRSKMLHTNCSFESSRYQRIVRGKASGHALKRIQQRGIPNGCVSLILAFGSQEHDGIGGIRYLMTASAMERVCSTLGKTKQILNLAGMYAVVSTGDSTVITVGHRYQ
jgi:hypothetical protein